MDQTANISTVGSATSPTLIPSHFFQRALLFCLVEFSRRSVSFLRALLHASIFNQLHTLCHFFSRFSLKSQSIYNRHTDPDTHTHSYNAAQANAHICRRVYTVHHSANLRGLAHSEVCLLSKCDYKNVKTKADSGDYLGRITTA